MRTNDRASSHYQRLVVSTLVLMMGLFAAPASAGPVVVIDEKRSHYEIRGRTFDELRRQMKRKGPKGFWAYARWKVRTKKPCRVIVTIRYTLPKLVGDAPSGVQREWKRMLARLERHEANHGWHGMRAGKEIARNRCANAGVIARRWATADKIYDVLTGHGRLEGVYLP